MPREPLPSPLLAARSLENGMPAYRQSRESIFVKQGKLLANYEDDYVYDRPVLRYFPTYQSLTDSELRGYFSWRTKLRRGNLQETSLSYAFLYIYELLNQIGVADPMDGYRKLTEFRDAYGALDDGILPYLNQWLMDYVVYYNLDAGLLADDPQVRFNRSIAVLEPWRRRSHPRGEAAVAEMAGALQILQGIPGGLRHRDRPGAAEDGGALRYPVQKDHGRAVFWKLYPVSGDSVRLGGFSQASGAGQYTVDEKYIYRCHNGLWSVQKYSCIPHSNGKLGDVLKAIDAVMRECYDYGRPIQYKLETKWIIKIIQEEARNLLAEKKAAEEKKITIDYSRLARIRDDAAVTRDRLMVDEEAEEEAPPVQPPEPAAEPEDTPLTKDEYRLLQSLLYGRDYGWVRSSGLMLSVLVDGINDKLYDTFFDSVLLGDDPPELIEDYIADLKEMIHP